MKRVAYLFLAVLSFAFPPPACAAASYHGAIVAGVYYPPDGTFVLWLRPDGALSRRLNPLAQWAGMSTAVGLYERYAEGENLGALGYSIAAEATMKLRCGEAYGILEALLRNAGSPRVPSDQELTDFCVANGGGKMLQCADWIRLVGSERPGCVSLGEGGGGDSKLRLQPSDPSGCCKVTLPCIVRNQPGRKSGEEWTEAVRTPQGGRIGCRLRNVVEGQPPPVTPPPAPAPGDTASCASSLTQAQASLATCQGRVADLESRKLVGLNTAASAAVLHKAASDLLAMADLLRSLHQRQCLAAATP